MPIDDDEDTDYGCATCDWRSTNEDDFVLVGDDLLCGSCRSYCHYCEEYFHEDNAHYVEGIGDYCESCWENYTFYCERCSSNYHQDVSQYHIEDRGEYWCEGCFTDNGAYCEGCDQYYYSECSDCGESARNTLIHDYSYKPDPKFVGQDSNNLYFGIELEMEIRSGDLTSSARYVKDNIGDWFYMKRDSTIEKGGYRGFELVSHPISFDRWQNFPLFDKTLNYLREHQQARSWDAKYCGLHIHVSRAGFRSGAHTHRWLALIFKNSPEMMKFAGRKSETYAKFSDVWKFDEFDRPYFTLADKVANPRQVNTDRYSAVNTQNDHTLELRFFRGTTKPSGVRSAIQLAHASIEYTRNLTLSDVKLGMLGWDWFYEYVEANNGFYPDLYERMSKVRSLSIDSKELVNA